MSPLVSLELRWFLDGAVSKSVDKWFRESLPSPEIGPIDPRGDVYLFQPTVEDFGIKLRQKKLDSPYSLEIKWREFVKPFTGAHGTEGQIERWTKWGWEDPKGPGPKDITLLAAPDGPWVMVSKKRWQRKYSWMNGKFVPVPANEIKDTIVEIGTAIEIADLQVNARSYCTVLIETFAPDPRKQEEILELAVEYLWRDYPKLLPKSEQSYGYPAWLNRYGSAVKK